MSIPNCRAVSGLLATIVPFVLAQTGAADNRWVQLGPAGGMVYVISVSPNSADSVVAGTYYGGPFASITGGDSWSPSNSGLSDTRAFAYLDSASTVRSWERASIILGLAAGRAKQEIAKQSACS